MAVESAKGPGDQEALRVVVVARPSAANQYVLSDVTRVCRLQQLFTASTSRPRRTYRWAYERLTKAPLATLGKPGRSVVLRYLESRLDRELVARLGESGFSFAGARVIDAADLNGDVGESIIKDLAPDLMILSGAPILKLRIYTLPRLGTVNLHWGISPNYRGEQGIFTALRRRDYDSIGVTLHYLDEGIDTGPVLAQGWPPLGPASSIADIWADAARLASSMLTDFVERLRGGPVPGQRQPGKGLLIRDRDRRLWHHAQYGVDRWALRRHPPYSEGRIVRYW